MVEINQALQALLTTVGVALLSAIGVILVQAVNIGKEWALTKLDGVADENARKLLNDAVNQVSEIVATVVTSIEQEEKQELLKAMEDGKVTRDELCGLKDIAVGRIKAQLLPDTLSLLEESFGDVTEYISDKVSQQVFALKNIL